jgi:hypothetical protein
MLNVQRTLEAFIESRSGSHPPTPFKGGPSG